jgi:hypothetical protein
VQAEEEDEMERTISPTGWMFVALLGAAVVVHFWNQDIGKPIPKPIPPAVKVGPAIDRAAIAQFEKLVGEYNDQSRLAQAKKVGTPENELAQINRIFCSRYLADAYSGLNPAERVLVGPAHQKEEVFTPDMMSLFSVFNEKDRDVWENEFRESLERRGFKFRKD